MERDRTIYEEQSQTAVIPDSGSSNRLQAVRNRMREMLEHADRVMDSISHIDAETFLEQNEQTGGQ